jgi:hypothetical protein
LLAFTLDFQNDLFQLKAKARRCSPQHAFYSVYIQLADLAAAPTHEEGWRDLAVRRVIADHEGVACDHAMHQLHLSKKSQCPVDDDRGDAFAVPNAVSEVISCERLGTARELLEDATPHRGEAEMPFLAKPLSSSDECHRAARRPIFMDVEAT